MIVEDDIVPLLTRGALTEAGCGRIADDVGRSALSMIVHYVVDGAILDERAERMVFPVAHALMRRAPFCSTAYAPD